MRCFPAGPATYCKKRLREHFSFHSRPGDFGAPQRTKPTRASAYLLCPSVLAAEPLPYSTLASIGKAGQSVKQKRLRSMNRRKQRFSRSETMNRTIMPNREIKVSAYLGRNGAIPLPSEGNGPNCGTWDCAEKWSLDTPVMVIPINNENSGSRRSGQSR